MRTKKRRLNDLVKAIKNGSFKLVEGKKKWYCYDVTITRLTEEQDGRDGWSLDVVYLTGWKIGIIKLDAIQNDYELEIK